MLAEHSHIRDDYQQLIELTLIVLVSPPTTIHWRAPGPVNHTRWMAKLLYSMKIYLFRNQRHVFKLTTKEEAQLQRILLFRALLYTKSWTEASLAADDPGCDLMIWKDLVKYEVIDHKIASEARKILERHMSYLSDETVRLSALF